MRCNNDGHCRLATAGRVGSSEPGASGATCSGRRAYGSVRWHSLRQQVESSARYRLEVAITEAKTSERGDLAADDAHVPFVPRIYPSG